MLGNTKLSRGVVFGRGPADAVLTTMRGAKNQRRI